MLGDVTVGDGYRDALALSCNHLAQLRHRLGVVLHEVQLDVAGQRGVFVGVPQQHGSGAL